MNDIKYVVLRQTHLPDGNDYYEYRRQENSAWFPVDFDRVNWHDAISYADLNDAGWAMEDEYLSSNDSYGFCIQRVRMW
jgi:hypothetical protein